MRISYKLLPQIQDELVLKIPPKDITCIGNLSQDQLYAFILRELSNEDSLCYWKTRSLLDIVSGVDLPEQNAYPRVIIFEKKDGHHGFIATYDLVNWFRNPTVGDPHGIPHATNLRGVLRDIGAPILSQSGADNWRNVQRAVLAGAGEEAFRNLVETARMDEGVDSRGLVPSQAVVSFLEQAKQFGNQMAVRVLYETFNGVEGHANTRQFALGCCLETHHIAAPVLYINGEGFDVDDVIRDTLREFPSHFNVLEYLLYRAVNSDNVDLEIPLSEYNSYFKTQHLSTRDLAVYLLNKQPNDPRILYRLGLILEKDSNRGAGVNIDEAHRLWIDQNKMSLTCSDSFAATIALDPFNSEAYVRLANRLSQGEKINLPQSLRLVSFYDVNTVIDTANQWDVPRGPRVSARDLLKVAMYYSRTNNPEICIKLASELLREAVPTDRHNVPLLQARTTILARHYHDSNCPPNCQIHANINSKSPYELVLDAISNSVVPNPLPYLILAENAGSITSMDVHEYAHGRGQVVTVMYTPSQLVSKAITLAGDDSDKDIYDRSEKWIDANEDRVLGVNIDGRNHILSQSTDIWLLFIFRFPDHLYGYERLLDLMNDHQLLHLYAPNDRLSAIQTESSELRGLTITRRECAQLILGLQENHPRAAVYELRYACEGEETPLKEVQVAVNALSTKHNKIHQNDLIQGLYVALNKYGDMPCDFHSENIEDQKHRESLSLIFENGHLSKKRARGLCLFQ